MAGSLLKYLEQVELLTWCIQGLARTSCLRSCFIYSGSTCVRPLASGLFAKPDYI